MWSHYATAHTGMCVGFERNKDNALGNDGICLPVTYSRNYLTVDTMRIFYLENTQFINNWDLVDCSA